jgi:fatty-acyl-CoA synthase
MDATFSPHTAATVARARQHSVGDLLHRSAARYPDKLAVVAGDLRVSYAEFDAAVNRTAHALAELGLTKGDRLARRSRLTRPSHPTCRFRLLARRTASASRRHSP